MIAPTAWAAAGWLADDGQGGENTKSGPIGLVVIIVLCVACYFLFKSMSKHLKKVREHPPTEHLRERDTDSARDGRAAGRPGKHARTELSPVAPVRDRP